MSFSKVEKVSDWLNPLLVREVRQSLRGRVFAGAIIFTALFSVITIVMGIIAQDSGHRDMKTGQGFFYAVYFFVWALGCVILPTIAANRFRQEKTTGEFELFSITGISPHRIVAGKLQSSLIQTLLIISITAPFMMVCYLLRGISALDIMIDIVILIAFSIVFTQGGIFLGCIRTSKAFFSIISLVFIVGLFCSFSLAGAILSSEILNDWTEVLILAAALIYAFCLAYICSVSLLMLPNRNRTLGLKLFLLVCAIVLPLAGVLLGQSGTHYRVAEPILYGFFMIPAIIASLFVWTPLTTAPKPVQKNWQMSRLKIFRPLFYPGRGGTLIWVSTLMLILIAWENFIQNTRSTDRIFVITAGFAIWSLLANLVGRIFFKKAPTALLSLMGNMLPSIIALFFAVSQNEKVATFLCPATLPVWIDRYHQWSEAMVLAITFWICLFIAGSFSYTHQLKMERENESGS